MNKSVALGSLIVLLAVAAVAQDYAIKLQQPRTVGQRFKFTATSSQSSEMTMKVDGRVVKEDNEKLDVEMESVATVLAIDAKGRATRESHVIVKLLVGAEKKPLLAPGTTVTAWRSGRQEEFEVGGSPAPVPVAKMLRQAVSITGGGPTDDEIFGTTERKKVGDSWSLNEALALKDANEKLGMDGLKVSSVTGTTTLQKVTKDNDVDVLHLMANMTATLSASGKGPFTSVDSTVTATFTGAFPTDKSGWEEGETTVMDIKASGKPNPEGPELQLSGQMKRSVSKSCKLLAP